MLQQWVLDAARHEDPTLEVCFSEEERPRPQKPCRLKKLSQTSVTTVCSARRVLLLEVVMFL